MENNNSREIKELQIKVDEQNKRIHELEKFISDQRVKNVIDKATVEGLLKEVNRLGQAIKGVHGRISGQIHGVINRRRNNNFYDKNNNFYNKNNFYDKNSDVINTKDKDSKSKK